MATEANNFALITRQLVLKKLHQTFPDPVVAEQALKCLDTYRDSEFVMNSVHIAIIKLSGGSLRHLRDIVTEAKKSDVRDNNILSAARTPEQHKLSVERCQLVKAGGDTRFMKKISPKKMAAMKKSDHAQWVAWLASE